MKLINLEKKVQILTIGDYSDLTNNMIGFRTGGELQAYSETVDQTFSSISSMVDWTSESGESLTDVYMRLSSHITSSNYFNIIADTFTIRTIDHEAFQILTEKIIGRVLQNYFLGLSDEELSNPNIVDWHKLPVRYLEYDFRMVGNAWSNPLIGQGTDVFSRARHVNGVTNGIIGLNALTEYKSWSVPHEIGLGYTDVAGHTFLRSDGVWDYKKRFDRPRYSPLSTPNGRSLSGLFIGPDTTRYGLDPSYGTLVSDQIIYDWAYMNWDPVYAAKGAEYVYYDLLRKAREGGFSVSNRPETTFDVMPEIGLITAPGYRDFGASLIDRLGRNWAKEGVGKAWINPSPGIIFGPNIMTVDLGVTSTGQWITASPIIRNSDDTPPILY
ncbi:MAG: hypothetical protein HeimC2_37280 [Candidatus Heimdallarchaeota archaeon LC_2]|nr:MAG: hypothetical protein HeimC2_37280 [Candidatus Heimdallarchaeota archaeon LC_2]